MGVRQQQQTGGSLSNVSIGKGIGVGILAWIVTFVLANLLFVLEIGNSDQGFEYYGQTGWRDLVGYKFGENYFSAYPGAFDSPERLNELLVSYDTVPDIVYILLVVGILALLGYRMVSNAVADFDEVGAAAQGATMAIPYAVLMGLTVLAVGAFMEDNLLVLSSDIFSDELTNIVIVGGIIYPAVFGGLGGVAAVFREKQSAGQQPAGRPPAQGQPPAGGQARAPQHQPGQPQGQRPGGQQAGQPQGGQQTRQPQGGQPQGGQPQGGQPQGSHQSGQPQGGQPRDAQQPGRPQSGQQPPTEEPATDDADASEESSEDDGDDSVDSAGADDASGTGSGNPSGDI
ncbi:hypothetical protein [Halapricum salinum]|uniref:DUF7978 domain-containing protein n=1 Tax=Halapricum salinum TaxID=1457250 RepID=A0A4D6H980_9EURY|nr:hypothetical protein [Halapricum salinum]QCC50205.1 hypothetical protein DV733_02695 [Halapricum salinum]